jgi:hypothetical protein
MHIATWEEAVADLGLWTDRELELLTKHAGPLGVDITHWVFVMAMARRVEDARLWFPRHLEEHGPEWIRTGPDGATTIRIEALGDLVCPTEGPRGVQCLFQEKSIRLLDNPPRQSVRSWWHGRGRPPRIWEFRPAHCECTMPGRVQRLNA